MRWVNKVALHIMSATGVFFFTLSRLFYSLCSLEVGEVVSEKPPTSTVFWKDHSDT